MASGGVRERAGRPHEHIDYVNVSYNLWGDEETILIGPYLNRKGETNKATLERARAIGRHYVTEQAQSVMVWKAKCCISQFTREDLEPVTEGEREDDWKFDEEMRQMVAYAQKYEESEPH